MTEEDRQVIYRGLDAARDLLEDMSAEDIHRITGIPLEQCSVLLGHVRLGAAMLPSPWFRP